MSANLSSPAARTLAAWLLAAACLTTTACAPGRGTSSPAPAPASAPVATAASPAAPARGLYVPRDVAAAYEKGTRSPDGRPGPRYWQNRARYTMTIAAAPPARTVRGTEEIVYFNESPDTLGNPVIRLFLNIHKPGAPRAGGVGEEYLTSGMHMDAVSVNGSRVAWPDDPQVFTWRPLHLPEPLLPGDSVRLSFDWHYDVSLASNREGMLDSTTFFLAYFYPRVAVYDDYAGWDRTNFDDRLEFYSDFNDYDVTVRVPDGYIVWGTGTLANPEEVLQPAALERYRASLGADTTIRVATAADLAARRVTARRGTNAWRFTATNVPDVAFNVGDHYLWDAASVVVDSATGRRASVQAAYADSAADFRYMVQWGRHALDWFSREWPGVPYPYEKTTIVLGFADMEYPMMVNDESFADTVFARFVAEHEIAHSWFPFYMGINETRYTFMDEGWATALEYLIAREDLGPERAGAFFRQFRVNDWIADPSASEDLPIVTPFRSGNNGYGKPALAYLALKDLLGDSLFRAGLHAYMDRWHGKHPLPWDFFATFDDVTGRRLDWFWRAWFFENAYIDVAVSGVTSGGRGTTVTLENRGGMAVPVDLRVTYADGSTATVHRTPAVWEKDPRRATIALPGAKAVRAVALDHGIWVDADAANDRWAAK